MRASIFQGMQNLDSALFWRKNFETQNRIRWGLCLLRHRTTKSGLELNHSFLGPNSCLCSCKKYWSLFVKVKKWLDRLYRANFYNFLKTSHYRPLFLHKIAGRSTIWCSFPHYLILFLSLQALHKKKVVLGTEPWTLGHVADFKKLNDQTTNKAKAMEDCKHSTKQQQQK